MRNPRRPAALAGLAALLMSGLVAVTHGTAQAAPDPRPQLARHDTGADTRAEQREVREYWTPKRMRNAQPLDVTAPAPQGAAVERGKPTTVKGKPGGSSDGYLGGPWTGGGSVVRTTGKVFFTLGGANYVCSGSAVTSANESTVTTAGHCLNEGPGAYASSFSFVPAYDNGAAPYGEWVATELFTTTQWANQGDFNYDVGMAKVAPLGGATLTDTVGSQGIAFNQPRGQFVHAFGYPAASPYDGQSLTYCSGTTTDDTRGTNDLRLACNMTGGSSGGPWFQGFSNGTGTQISVNSFGYRGEKNAMYGPYFGSVIQSLYSAASSS
jgi:V8-like Glu-specific endopeptidase